MADHHMRAADAKAGGAITYLVSSMKT